MGFFVGSCGEGFSWLSVGFQHGFLRVCFFYGGGVSLFGDVVLALVFSVRSGVRSV